ncbi:GGDEF domain-containing protein [Vibrio panuliri]|uniref:GGDEF domain-containing protein n=1 Tax=Vibrio panuliri TaxID=1381081 RepID=A0ABX3F874_9VIBR|nr:GGDEF domain-containing protein [Vibrio panuliri]KAB1458305.1 diguanylate cyclase [Vibrio panuliri]OLQ86783.1 hypothetical protein BIY20_02520 [Vibrio panuliri]
MKKLSSYIISVFLTLTTIPIALFGGTYIIYDLLHQHEAQTNQYEQVIAQQLLDSKIALTQFDLLQAELVATKISQLDYIVSVKLDSLEYGLTLAEVVNSKAQRDSMTSLHYPINDQEGDVIGQLTVNKDETAFVWNIVKATAPKLFNLTLILVAVSFAFTHTILAALNRPFTDLQIVAFQIANGDYHTPSKTDSKFLEITTLFNALDTMRRQLKSTISRLKDSEEKHARTYNLTQVCLFVINIKQQRIVRANSTFIDVFSPLATPQRKLAMVDFLERLSAKETEDSFNYSIVIGNQTRYFQVNRSQVINNEIECSALDISELMQAKLATELLLKTDSLTQIPNRHCFNLAIHDIEKQTNPDIGVLVMDLNGFKAINDTYGHIAGDVLLVEVARRLKEALMDSPATLYRLGGDEFVILVEQASHPIAINSIIDKVVGVFVRPVLFEQTQFQVSTSIGVAHYHGQNNNITNTMRLADEAMYKAKTSGVSVAYAENYIDQCAV